MNSVLDATAEHMQKCLTAAATAKGGALAGALSFVVVVPGWTEGAGWALLEGSPFLQFKLVVAAADHGFCDGASHQRKDPYHQSPYDTAVFVLQTDAASRPSHLLRYVLHNSCGFLTMGLRC